MQEGLAFTPQLGASGVAQWLWLVPAVPMVAAGVIALLKQPMRKLSSGLAIGSLGFSLLVALAAFGHVLSGWSHGYAVREVVNFTWIQVGDGAGRTGMGARSAGGRDAGDGHVCRAADLHLLDRLHGARRELHAVLLLPEFVCGRDAGRGDCEQHSAAVHVLGTGGAHVVSADRVLVSEAFGGSGGEEGISDDARWRCVLSSWHCLAVCADRDAAVL